MTMTGKQRIDAVLNGEKPDIIPRTPILMQFAAEYIGSNYGLFASDYRVLVEANLKTARDFSFDQVSAISDPYRETHGFGADIVFVANGVPRCVRHPLEDEPDLEKLPTPDPFADARMLDRIKAIQAFKNQAEEYSILGWIEGPAAEAADLRNVENFLVDLLDDPGYACDLMDRTLVNAVNFAKAQIEAGCDMIGIGDAIASQVGPDLYGEYILPREKHLIDAIRKLGAKTKLHICGDITPILDMLADARPDVLDCDHMVSLEKARKAVGNKMTLAGNVDPVGTVLRGTPDSIRDAIKKARDQAGMPWFVNAGCEIPPGTPPENLRALCEPLMP